MTPRVIFVTLSKMPGRKIPLVTNEIYHVVNRGISLQPTFLTKKDYLRALETIFYYQNEKTTLKYSRFLNLARQERIKLLENLRKKRQFLAEIICLCLMSNHFHLLLKQTVSDGVSKFISNFTNSYTRYFNTKNTRFGPIFQGKFKAVRIESNEQLLHVSRYIHLNPYTSYVVKDLEQIKKYPYSSLPEYLAQSKANFYEKEVILNQFENNLSYWKFLTSQADYQSSLEKIKHLILEKGF